jgi:hypothetical protein
MCRIKNGQIRKQTYDGLAKRSTRKKSRSEARMEMIKCRRCEEG